jgi:hypothetical protein
VHKELTEHFRSGCCATAAGKARLIEWRIVKPDSSASNELYEAFFSEEIDLPYDQFLSFVCKKSEQRMPNSQCCQQVIKAIPKYAKKQKNLTGLQAIELAGETGTLVRNVSRNGFSKMWTHRLECDCPHYDRRLRRQDWFGRGIQTAIGKPR